MKIEVDIPDIKYKKDDVIKIYIAGNTLIGKVIAVINTISVKDSIELILNESYRGFYQVAICHNGSFNIQENGLLKSDIRQYDITTLEDISELWIEKTPPFRLSYINELLMQEPHYADEAELIDNTELIDIIKYQTELIKRLNNGLSKLDTAYCDLISKESTVKSQLSTEEYENISDINVEAETFLQLDGINKYYIVYDDNQYENMTNSLYARHLIDIVKAIDIKEAKQKFIKIYGPSYKDHVHVEAEIIDETKIAYIREKILENIYIYELLKELKDYKF